MNNIENKIKRLEILDKILIIITAIMGIITVIDLFIPDPIFLLDEAALASITGLTTYLSSIVRSKIEKLKNGNKIKLNTKELSDITNEVTKTAKVVKKSRNK